MHRIPASSVRPPAAAGCLPSGSSYCFSPSPRPPRQSLRLSSFPPHIEPDVDSAWSRMLLLKRQLAVAVSEEDFKSAATLKTEVQRIEESLPAQKQIVASLIDRLANGETAKDRTLAAQALGDIGDPASLSALQAALGDRVIGDVVESSMWSVFMRSPTEEVERLMQEGMSALQRPSTWPRAVDTFTKVIQAAPGFAEGFNKRATTLYMMKRHKEAIEDCKLVLEINPFHFGAASGMGMCSAALGDYVGAIQAFQTAIRINPRLTYLKHHIIQLTTLLEENLREKNDTDTPREDH